MGVKEEVSKSYTDQWHERTKDWKFPDIRSAFVAGSNREDNIGYEIAYELKCAGIRTAEYDLSDGDLVMERDQKSIRWGDYDTIVLANGSTHLDWLEDQPTVEIDDVIENKLVASIKSTRSFVRATIDYPVIKNIVYIGSMAANSVLNGSSIYCAACAGLQHYARCAAWELAPKGYRVYLLNPSNTEGTPMTEETIKGLQAYRFLDRESAEAYWGATRALPRWLQPGNIASITRYLVTDPNAEWLSGAPLNLGGGLR